jgi:O-methyltransferase involved in polyketide biosynthesis
VNKKVEIDLKGIPQTLLLPLIGRAKFSEESYSPFYDEKAIKLVSSLNYDFDNLLAVKNVRQSTLFWMARAYHFDEAIKTYLKEHPNAVIVNLGCGLDTAFNRVDNGKLSWIDIDLPEVIELRQKLLPPTHREHYIAKSVLNFSWIDDVKKFGNELFFFAGGLFTYFTEDQVKSIFITMANRFPKAELIFDNISPKGLKYANNMLKKSDMKDALLQWSIYDGKKLEAWSPKIKVVSSQPYFKGIKSTLNFPLSLKAKMVLFDLFHRSGIIHLKFSYTINAFN